MSNFKVTINKETAWLVTDKRTGMSRKFWNKNDAENYLDQQENTQPKTKGRKFQAQKRKA
tara:strand:+ start:374 stop:553 length:180 start_codon:yes stop_codon:yes gene_type:complete